MAYTKLGSTAPGHVVNSLLDPMAQLNAAIAAARDNKKPTINQTKIITGSRVTLPSLLKSPSTISQNSTSDATGSVLLAGGVFVLVVGGLVAVAKKLAKKSA
jgi:hypothetical protein